MSVPSNSDVERQTQAAAQPAGSDEEVLLAPHRLRLVAFLIDILFFAIVVGIGFLAGAFVGWLAWAFWLVAALTFIYYMAMTTWLMNQTLGKAMTGLTVRRIEGAFEEPSFSGLRWAVGRHTLGYLIADVFFLGSAAALSTPRRRALHDYAFGSEVVLTPATESYKTRYVEFWDSFFTKLDETKEGKELRALIRPWKWLMGVMASISLWLFGPLIARASASAHSAPASTAPAAKSLSLSGKTALWTATTVATGAAVTGIVTASTGANPIESVNVVYNVATVGRPNTGEIFIMKADGDELLRLTNNDWRDFSPDLFADRKIVFVSEKDGNSEIYVMDADGAHQERLTRDESPDQEPDWSPNGEQIAFASDRSGHTEVYIMNATGSDQHAVGIGRESYSTSPDWSPDGKRLAFVSQRDGVENIFIANADGSAGVAVTSNGGRAPAWSPDGRLIAFTSNRDGNTNIYLVEANGEGERQLTDDPAEDIDPKWTPDGTKLLFASERSQTRGGNDLFVMNPDGSDEKKLTSLQGLLNDG